MSSALSGKRIVNTRAPHQAAELDDLLRERGAEPLSYPCIQIAPPADMRPLDDALREAHDGRFDWLLLTSTNVVHAVGERLAAVGLGPLPAELHLAAVGAATAQAAERELGRMPELLPEDALAESLLASFPRREDLRVLLPQGDLARPLLACGLAERNTHVTSVLAYRTMIGSGGVDLPRLLAQRQVDAAALTSPSTAKNLTLRLQAEGAAQDSLAQLPLACIGPLTATAAAELSPIVFEAAEHSMAGLIDALERCFTTRGDDS